MTSSPVPDISGHVEFAAAVFAMQGVNAMAVFFANRAAPGQDGIGVLSLVDSLPELPRDNRGRDCDDAVAHQHAKPGHKTSRRRLRHQIAVAYRGDGHNGPVNTERNTFETVGRPFYDICLLYTSDAADE